MVTYLLLNCSRATQPHSAVFSKCFILLWDAARMGTVLHTVSSAVHCTLVHSWVDTNSWGHFKRILTLQLSSAYTASIPQFLLHNFCTRGESPSLPGKAAPRPNGGTIPALLDTRGGMKANLTLGWWSYSGGVVLHALKHAWQETWPCHTITQLDQDPPPK